MKTMRPGFVLRRCRRLWMGVPILLIGLACLFPSLNFTATPVEKTQTVSTGTPASVNKITVEPYDPSGGGLYPSLTNLVKGWHSIVSPSARTWSVQVSSGQPVIIDEIWCTADAAVLEQNFQHIAYSIVIDEVSIPTGSLFEYDQSSSDQVCRNHVGIIRRWPLGEHTIVITSIYDEMINDGWNDYPAGDYVQAYDITVTP